MDFPNDGFKGFEDGFEGFPKRLPEDCVKYTLFIIDTKLRTPKEVLGRLEAVRKESFKLTERLLEEYIWQRENFKLELESINGRMCLHGATNYGDSVEDEWLIVYILRQLSNTFLDLWVRVVDTDGEFLLIEAANALPRWLNPEIAENRVWIHHNKLRIIPLIAPTPSLTATETAPVSRPLSLDEAIQTITSNPQKLIHSPLVEEEAFYRLRNYPQQISVSLHHAPIELPRKLAYILHDRPASIAPAIEAFYLRDPIALKALDPSFSDIEFMPEDMVTVSTRFTKVLYAQLKSQQFEPPLGWTDIFSQSKARITESPISKKKFEQLELGMKVTSGFEMLLKDPKNGDNRVVRELNILLEDLRADNYSDLPSDEKILQWRDVTREDNDSWMDINFEDFEQELSGKARNMGTARDPMAPKSDAPSGFGDSKTQTDLKKMVERFEAFLNDESAGPDGVEMDDMDLDDDDEDEDEEEESGSDDSEDRDVSFDEKEFARMMKEMMGMPSEDEGVQKTSVASKRKSGTSSSVQDKPSRDGDEEDEMEEIEKVMERMEAELNAAGALNLDPAPSKDLALKGNSKGTTELDDSEDEEDGEVNIDFNLAKNLLQSFKSQGGMAGPGSNLLAMMGMQLPRDEDDVKPSSAN